MWIQEPWLGGKRVVGDWGVDEEPSYENLWLLLSEEIRRLWSCLVSWILNRKVVAKTFLIKNPKSCQKDPVSNQKWITARNIQWGWIINTIRRVVLFSEAESEEWFAWKLNSSQMAEFLPFSLARGQFSHLTPGSCHQHVIEGNGGWQRWSWVTEPISCQMWRHLIWHICHKGWWELSVQYVGLCPGMPLRRNEDGKGEGEEDGWIQEEVKLAQLCQHYQHCVNIISTVHCALYSVPRWLEKYITATCYIIIIIIIDVEEDTVVSTSSSSSPPSSVSTLSAPEWKHGRGNSPTPQFGGPKTDRGQIQL